MLSRDWQTLYASYLETIAAIGGLQFIRAIVTKDGITLVPKEGEQIKLTDFHCGNGDASAAHFAACILERVGLGDFTTLRAFLRAGDQVIAYRVGDNVILGAQRRCE